MILDEATSSVDTETELLIQQALERADDRSDPTVIIRGPALHDPQRGRGSVVLEGRRIVETGTHAESMAHDRALPAPERGTDEGRPPVGGDRRGAGSECELEA